MTLRTRISGEPRRVLAGRTRGQTAAANPGAVPKAPTEPVGLPHPVRELKGRIAELERRVAQLEKGGRRGGS